MKPEDVPTNLVDAAWAVCEREGIPWHDDAARMILAAVLPEARKEWFSELLGTPEEIAAREAEAEQRTPDDTVRLCELARPGDHERRVRDQVAAEARVAAAEFRQKPLFRTEAGALEWFAARLTASKREETL